MKQSERETLSLRLREFETRIANLFNAGELPYLIHLSGGNEEKLCRLFEAIKPGDWVISTHRNHYHYLLAGGKEHDLEKLILKGQSMFVYSRNLKFITSSIVAGTCSIAAGIAWEIKQRGGKEWVWCFIGDAATDEGHFWEAAHWVSANDLPCQFIVEDNNRSCETTKSQRRGTIETHEYPSSVMRYEYQTVYPHAGSGTKKHIIFKTISKQ